MMSVVAITQRLSFKLRTEWGKIVDIPLLESAASISIKGDKLDVNVLGITVKEGQKIALPKTLKSN